MSDFPEQLVRIAQDLEGGKKPETVSVRAFLDWFGAQRRGFYVVQNIRGALSKLGVSTEPDFEAAYIDGPISFTRIADNNGGAATGKIQEAPPSLAVTVVDREPVDPTQRIGRLASANNPPLSVKPDTTLMEAVTKMLGNDYSQLPVMQTEREVRGVISWHSIGSRLALGRQCHLVRDCMDEHHEIGYDTPLFAAVDGVIRYEYVLIRGSNRAISGIVTTSDLSHQFMQLGEPFLLLGEIENHIRRLMDGKFTPTDLASAKDPSDTKRSVSKVSDLSFGEYVRLLSSPDKWSKLGLPIDRGDFIQQLGRVRIIRNDVMHFDPDGVAPTDLAALRNFARFMEGLRSIGVT